MRSFKPSGVITLTTDFGLEDPFVGVMKGRVLARFPAAQIVDLTHAVPPQSPAEAGFWLCRCLVYFPAGTVHVAVVDPGVGTARAIVCTVAGGHAILAPDNGLLREIWARHPSAETVRLTATALAALGIERVSSTFHGRDIFAPVAAELAASRCRPEALGDRVEMPTPDAAPGGPRGDAKSRPGQLSGSVVTVDHFGNLITDIEAQAVAHRSEVWVSVAGRRLRLQRTYGEARPGELLALINAFDVVEVAEREGNAARTLGVGRGAPVIVSVS